MTLRPAYRRPRSVVVVVFAALALLLGGPSGVASADPDVDEGGNASLAKQLEEAAVAFRESLERLISEDPTIDSVDEFIGGFEVLMTQPVRFH